MKCPKCLKEITDEASFCGYCGQAIDKKPIQDVSVDDSINIGGQAKQKPTENCLTEPKNKGTVKKQNKHTGLKLLLIFSIIAIAAGTVLGLLANKGIIDLSKIFPDNRFEWTDFSEALDAESESAPSDETLDDKVQDDASDKDSEKTQSAQNNAL